MRRSRWLAAVLAALMLAVCAAGLAAPARAEAAVPSPSPEIGQEIDVHALVEQLFAAAAGTTWENEQALRKDMTPEERADRDASLAAHRSLALPWLAESFRPAEGGEAGEWFLSAPSDEAAIPPADSDPGAEPSQEERLWTPEDGYAALQATQAGRDYLAALEPLGGADAESCLAATRKICAEWLGEIDHEKLAGINADYACWLYAPDTQIDYPVVRGADNSSYLHRLFNGDWNASGTLFIDYRNLPDFQDPNTLIYGHHMRNDSMFGSLTDYGLDGYYAAHPFLLMVSPKEIAVVELFAGYTTSRDDHCYDIAISDSDDMLAFVNAATAKSDFASGAEVLPGDRLVTLSTCAYVFENARYIAIGRLVTAWTEEEM